MRWFTAMSASGGATTLGRGFVHLAVGREHHAVFARRRLDTDHAVAHVTFNGFRRTTERFAQAAAAVKSDDDRLIRLELAYTAEIKALNESQVNSNAAIKALNARADELNRVASLGVKDAKAEAAKGLADLQKALEEQKSEAAKANEALANMIGWASR